MDGPLEQSVVVIADPDAGHQSAREADEDGVAIVLRRPGLAERLDPQRRRAAGALIGGGPEKIEQHRPGRASVELPDPRPQRFEPSLLGGRKTMRSYRIIAVGNRGIGGDQLDKLRSEEHTSELQSLMRISYAVFCLKKKNN